MAAGRSRAQDYKLQHDAMVIGLPRIRLMLEMASNETVDWVSAAYYDYFYFAPVSGDLAGVVFIHSEDDQFSMLFCEPENFAKLDWFWDKPDKEQRDLIEAFKRSHSGLRLEVDRAGNVVSQSFEAAAPKGKSASA